MSYFIEPQGLRVALQCFFIVSIGFVNEAKDVPAYVRRQIQPHPFADEVNAFIFAAHVCQNETFHRCRFCLAETRSKRAATVNGSHDTDPHAQDTSSISGLLS